MYQYRNYAYSPPGSVFPPRQQPPPPSFYPVVNTPSPSAAAAASQPYHPQGFNPFTAAGSDIINSASPAAGREFDPAHYRWPGFPRQDPPASTSAARIGSPDDGGSARQTLRHQDSSRYPPLVVPMSSNGGGGSFGDVRAPDINTRRFDRPFGDSADAQRFLPAASTTSPADRPPPSRVPDPRFSTSFERIPVFVDDEDLDGGQRAFRGGPPVADAAERTPREVDALTPSVHGGRYSVQQPQLHGRSRSVPALRRKDVDQQQQVPAARQSSDASAYRGGSQSLLALELNQARSPGTFNPSLTAGSRRDADLSPSAGRQLVLSPASRPTAVEPLASATGGGSRQPISAYRSNPAADFELSSPAQDGSRTVRSTSPRPLDVGSLHRSDSNFPHHHRRRRPVDADVSVDAIQTADFGVASSLGGMAFVAIVSLILCALGLQLLLRLKAGRIDATTSSSSVSVLPLAARLIVEEVAVALAAVVVALDLCCVLTVTLQCFFVLKLVSYVDGRERAFAYLKRCAASRIVTSAGFYLSIPVFLIGVMLYAVLQYAFVSAVICIIVFTAGLVCFIVTSAHSVHCWNVEKSKTSFSIRLPESLPPSDSSKQTTARSDNNSRNRIFKLSTLV